ncbi:raftlin isoform X2 [Dunckerocampus dactyliophorus]|uniref:raftlin isoform X2 n=1 Tax=Dunckerocampus dactyliophorus TaxID=161453 RepID=UPI0024067C52|nr:raftlin isoform X2 [Dunckerocampus dactyliophorus]
MGCRLPKLRKGEETQSPGNIYSTLRRPQVETKVGVSYTYHFLDFLLGKEEVPVSSVLCLSSVRELPVQVRELYAQGFVLVAVHPFVHPCGPRHAHIQRQLHRAVLVRETPSWDKSQERRWWRRGLETDVCAAGHQAADPEIQDVAEQGVMFVGFLQQPGGAPCFLANWDPDELSSLHSSPSPIHRHTLISANASPTDPAEPRRDDTERGGLPFEPGELAHESGDHNTRDHKPILALTGQPSEVHPEGSNECIQGVHIPLEESLETIQQPLGHTVQPCECQTPLETQERQPSPGMNTQEEHKPPEESPENHSRLPNVRERKDSALESTKNNNHIYLKTPETKKSEPSAPAQARLQLFALYNSTGEMNTSLRFYSLRVPLRVHKEAGLVTDIDGDWLDHMTQHFTNGAQLVDGFFHLGEDNVPPDNGVSSVDSVFIFHNSTEETTSTSYDAIVVEQWTVVDGVVVKADYVPLLQSLAPYGWRLMCVLPTPIVKTNSDGSLSTKQILFLQRPVLQRKRKDFKMLNLRGRHKAKKHSCGEMLEEGEDRSLVMETEMDKLRRTREDETDGRKRWSEEAQEDARQRDLSFLSGSSASLQDQEEETDIDSFLTSKGEKTVKWTDVCHTDGRRGVKEEVKMEERIKHQLFSGVC